MDEKKHACKNISKSMDEFNQPNNPIFGQVNIGKVLPKDK